MSASKIGTVTKERRLIVTFDSKKVMDIDPLIITQGAGDIICPQEAPSQSTPAQKAQEEMDLDRLQKAINQDAEGAFYALLEHISCKTEQQITVRYDRYVGGNTAFSYPESAGIVRVCEKTGLGFAISLDSNAQWVALDPYRGVQHTLLEGCRNVACTGAEPLGVSNCLNFGSPENPTVMWQFAQVVEGLADACMRLELPVTGGNVSFYNQTDTRAILPTPVIATAGRIKNVDTRVPSAWQDEGCVLYLLGERSNSTHLNFALIAEVLLGKRFGSLPDADFDAHIKLIDLLQRLSRAGVATSCADLSTGGLALALSLGCMRVLERGLCWMLFVRAMPLLRLRRFFANPQDVCLYL